MVSDAEILRRAEGTVGKQLRGKWRLDRVLGVGGMAAVFAATHRNGTRAAVKVLHPEAALTPSVKDRFLREGYLANRVEHPGAVSILDDDVDEDGTVFLVMELLSGETLEARLERHDRDLPLGDLLQIAYQVLDCLEAAHARGIVHRDLKPGNLFVTESGQVKILDFGIARLRLGKSGGHTTGSQALGTPGYMPPEQARGRWEEVDAQSDLWAVGAVLFALIVGRPVHEAHTVNEQLLAAMTRPAESIRTLAPDLPEVMAALVDKALAFSKEERFQDAAEMKAAVAEAYEQIAGAPIDQAPALSVQLPSRPVSVDPGAPTLDAASDPNASLPQTTARPVAGSLAGESSRTIRRVGMGAGAAGLALGGWLLLSPAPDERAPGGSSAHPASGASAEATRGAAEPSAEPPAEEAAEQDDPDTPSAAEPEVEDTEDDAPSTTAAASASTEAASAAPAPAPAPKRAVRWQRQPPKPKPAPREPEPPPAPKTDEPSPEDIDLFTRRK